MRNTGLLLLALGLSLGLTLVGPTPDLLAQGDPAAVERVRALDDEERLAARSRDLPALDRLWSDGLTVNAPNNKVVVGKKAVLDVFVHSGVINFSTFDRQIEFIRGDGDYVFIMGLETVTPLTDAPAAGLVAGRTMRRRFTNIWKNEGGTWRLFARRANVMPTP